MAKYTAGSRKVITLTEAKEMFLRQREAEGSAASTLGYYRGKLGQYIGFVGDKPVRELSLADGQAWVVHLQKRNRYEHHPNHRPPERPISRATLRGYVVAIKVFATYLFEEGLVKEDVFARLKVPKDTKRVVEVLSDGEIRRIYDVINPNTKMGARQFVAITVLLDTGIRAGELTGMKINDIDFKQSRIKVRGKGDKERLVPFGSTTAKALLRWINAFRPESESDRVFVSLTGEDCDLGASRCCLRTTRTARTGPNIGLNVSHYDLFPRAEPAIIPLLFSAQPT